MCSALTRRCKRLDVCQKYFPVCVVVSLFWLPCVAPLHQAEVSPTPTPPLHPTDIFWLVIQYWQGTLSHFKSQSAIVLSLLLH